MTIRSKFCQLKLARSMSPALYRRREKGRYVKEECMRSDHAMKGLRVCPVCVLVKRPVLAKFARAQHQDAFVSQFEVLDHCQSGVGLSQPYAVGEYAAIVAFQLCYGAEGAVFLELVERVPDGGVAELHIAYADLPGRAGASISARKSS